MSRKLKNILCKLRLWRHGNVKIGKGTTFGRGTVFYAPNETRIGNNVYIGKYCTLETDIIMGDDILLGNNVGLIGKYDHDFTKVGVSIKDSPAIRDADYDFKGKGLKVEIENDVWIGYGSIIVSGVKVGRGSIVAAGSVVTRNVPPYSIVAGNPARVVKMRFTEEEIKEHEKIYYQGK